MCYGYAMFRGERTLNRVLQNRASVLRTHDAMKSVQAYDKQYARRVDYESYDLCHGCNYVPVTTV